MAGDTTTGPLCIIAGEGQLPVDLAAAVAGANRPVILAQMQGHTCENPGNHEVVDFRVEKLAALFQALKARQVTDVVLAGTVHRPRIDWRAFDVATLLMAPRILRILSRGDDGLLRAVIAMFEGQGFRIRGAHEFLSDLVASPGTLTARAPTADDLRDAARAREILTALAPKDVAQACIVARNLCLGIESLYGSDALLRYVADNRAARHPHSGGVFAKIAKPGQDLRVDMPVIGPATVEAAVAAGLSGICLEAGRVMILSAADVIAKADEKGLSLWAS